MKIVIDTSCVLAVLLNEVSRKSIIDTTIGSQLMSPDIMPAELGNALSSMFKKKRIQIEHAQLAMHKFQSLPISFKPIQVTSALEIAYEYQIYAYDAYFLDLSNRHKVPLLTLDATMAETAKKMNLRTIEL
jgi:predicted nucleic acid-binding protein